MRTTARALIDTGPSVSVGIATADWLSLGTELAALETAGVELVHVDVMDGVFCPQMTGGPSLVRALPERFVKDVHLMIEEPLDKVDAYVGAGANIVTIQQESTRQPLAVLQHLRSTGVVRGVALTPSTEMTALEPLLDELELVMVLAINPGWSGQTFQPMTQRRLGQARQLIGERPIVLAVDGGITKANAGEVASFGVDLVVAGSAVFDGSDAARNAESIAAAVRGDGTRLFAGSPR